MRQVLPLLLLCAPALQLNLEFCAEDLGLESGSLGDEALTASSSYDPANVGPTNARLHNEGAGGAWCPREPVSREKDQQWIQVNLTAVRVITAVLTQGRFAGGQGQEYAQAYRLHYWRRGLADWKEYRDSLGRTVIPGNVDTYSTAVSSLSPPIVASALRLLPHSNHSRTVCLRLGLRGCTFTEGVEEYRMAQGQVRGATLELLDITYDGEEDSVTGVLSGGLGQLVDGKYGDNDFKALGDLGLVRGYEWVGWRNRSSAPLQLDFTFDRIRSFRRLTIHVNNHYTRDIQIFSRAKIYFSNEEGKFGDDRAVDFLYMPDTMIEEARNVSVNLHGEHGRFVMIQLFFAAKWILISEVTFESELYEEKPFLIAGGPAQGDVVVTKVGAKEEEQEGGGVEKVEDREKERKIELEVEFEGDSGKVDLNSKIEMDKVGRDVEAGNKDNMGEKERGPAVVQEGEQPQGAARHVGLIIGLLLTVISFLLLGILAVIYRGRGGKETPTHSLIATKIQDKVGAGIHFRDIGASYTPYKAPMRVYGEVCGAEASRLYTPPSSLYTAGFPQISKKFRSDPVMSDCTEDYAEPSVPANLLPPSTSMSDNIYCMARPPSPPHYTALHHPLPSRQMVHGGSEGQMSEGRGSAGQSSGGRGGTGLYSSSPPLYSLPQQVRPPVEGGRRRRRSRQHGKEEEEVERSSLSSAERLALEVAPAHRSEGRRREARTRRTSGRPPRETAGSGSSKTSVSNLSMTGSGDTCTKRPMEEVPAVDRSMLKLVERVGRGRWGEVHLCHLQSAPCSSSLVTVTSLDPACSQEDRVMFLAEARSLATLRSSNITTVLGLGLNEEPLLMVTEAADMGDLNMFLQDHVAESSLSQSPGVATLSYPTLLYIATQIASGLRAMELADLVHKDLATRNVLVFPGHRVKISQCGQARALYATDYSPLGPGGKLVPLRWMAWESLLLDVYTSKSDVWSFGVTLWEILTFAREQPHEAAAEEKVVESLSSLAEGGPALLSLARPYNCPREVQGLLVECWAPAATARPSPREIELFLQRKNLGFRPPAPS